MIGLIDTFVERTAEVDVPDLKDFFPEGEKPVWKIRGMVANELSICYEALKINNARDVSMQASAGPEASKEKIKALREQLGIDIDMPLDIAFRRKELEFASVLPKVSEEMAVKFSNKFPIEFYQITTKIFELTGLGQTPGKLKPSGKDQT